MSSSAREWSRRCVCVAVLGCGLGLTAAALGAGPARASFTPAPGTPLAVGAQPYMALAQDLDGDGQVDVAAMNGTSSSLSVFLRTPSGGFAAASGSPLATGLGPSKAAVADFNGDGRADIAVSNYVDGTVSVLLGQPGGGWVQEAGGAQSAPGAGAVAIADVNSDGRPDLLVPDFNSGGVSVLLRQPGGGFQTEGKPATGANPRDLAVADFNADGRPDTAVTNMGAGTVTVLLRQPGGGFAAEGLPIPVGETPAGIVARDLDGDGRPDLAVANIDSDNVSVLLRQAGGGFAPDPASPIAVGDAPVGIAAADIDGDGRTDLAVTNHSANTVSVLLRQAGGGYAPDPGSPVAVPAGPSGIAAADVDADGHPDLVVSSDEANVLSVLLNQRPGAGPPAPTAGAPRAPSPPGVAAVPATGIGIPGAGGRVAGELARALASADLDARLRSAAASSQVSERTSKQRSQRDAALERRLDSLLYGVPVTVRGNAGEVAAVAAALAISRRTAAGTQIALVQLPAVAVQLTGPATIVRIPVDGKAAAELMRAGVADAALSVAAQTADLAKDKLDSASEMGETESLRLQMAMDRLSKMMSTLSNMLGKISETSSAIVGNLKRPAPGTGKTRLRRRAAATANAANAAGHEAAALLAPVLRAHPTASPRATVALRPCAKRCTYPRFAR